MKKEKIFNIPNALTASRPILGLISTISFLSGNILLGLLLYIIGAVTDFFDGLVARNFNMHTKFGEKLDQWCDKFFTLFGLINSIFSSGPLFLLPLLAEIPIIKVNSIRKYKYKQECKTTKIGKIKTGIFFITMLLSMSMNVLKINPTIIFAMITITTILQAMTTINYISDGMKYNKQIQQTKQLTNYKTKNNKKKIEELKQLKYNLKKIKEKKKYKILVKRKK